MMHPGPLLTLTTDFGSADGYIGAMKGVILSICADARIIDLAHGIEPQNIKHAAMVLEAAVPFYPPGTIHLAVVDPGVGTSRRRIAALTETGRFVGPDNGIFGLVFRCYPPRRIFSIENPAFMFPGPATTFEGRDVFAPAAAYLANGLDPAELGPEISGPVPLAWPQNIVKEWEVTGVVITTDRFGNVITSIHWDDLPPEIPSFTVIIKNHRIPGPAASYYDDHVGEPMDFCRAIFGSSGYLELARPGGAAAAVLSASPGEIVRVDWSRTPNRRSVQ